MFKELPYFARSGGDLARRLIAGRMRPGIPETIKQRNCDAESRPAPSGVCPTTARLQRKPGDPSDYQGYGPWAQFPVSYPHYSADERSLHSLRIPSARRMLSCGRSVADTAVEHIPGRSSRVGVFGSSLRGLEVNGEWMLICMACSGLGPSARQHG